MRPSVFGTVSPTSVHLKLTLLSQYLNPLPTNIKMTKIDQFLSMISNGSLWIYLEVPTSV